MKSGGEQALGLAHSLACVALRAPRTVDALAGFLEELRKAAGATHVRLWSAAGGERLRLVASACEASLPALEPVEAGEAAQAFRDGASREVPNLLAEPALAAAGPGALALWPLPPEGEALGVLALFGPRPFGDARALFGPALELLAQLVRRQAAEESDAGSGASALAESRRKDEAIATLAHELRNPLAPIVTALQLMRTRDGDGRSVARERSLIERQVALLARMVDDLLDVSRVQRGKLELRREPTDFASIIARAVEAVQPAVARLRHSLSVTLPDEPLFLVADPVRLAQVVANLLTNAARYTPPGGRIRLMASREGEQAVVRVRDTGIGIPAELQRQIFEPFVQGPGGAERGGLGIGLSLVRAFVELHGGEVTVVSGGPGSGSEFTVRLPALPDRELQLPLEPLPGARVPESGEGRRVLVVDDNRDGAEMLAEALRLWGCDVRVADSGQAALEAVRERRPEIVLLDIGMPQMDGFEVARRLRADLALHDVRLVAVTGYGREMDFARSRDAGFDAHLMKPVELETVMAAVAAVPRTPAARPGHETTPSAVLVGRSTTRPPVG